MSEKREQLSRVETRLIGIAKVEAERVLQEALNDVIEAHGFSLSKTKIIAEDGKYFLVESLIEPKADAKDNV